MSYRERMETVTAVETKDLMNVGIKPETTPTVDPEAEICCKISPGVVDSKNSVSCFITLPISCFCTRTAMRVEDSAKRMDCKELMAAITKTTVVSFRTGPHMLTPGFVTEETKSLKAKGITEDMDALTINIA
mmetsp:Transcript_112273/g.194980  ORF Transcript_112273/g.194980 Transcript_112273/m.194980 type:complete len:132 (-) Transcript_112273:608-1003(-)